MDHLRSGLESMSTPLLSTHRPTSIRYTAQPVPNKPTYCIAISHSFSFFLFLLFLSLFLVNKDQTFSRWTSFDLFHPQCSTLEIDILSNEMDKKPKCPKTDFTFPQSLYRVANIFFLPFSKGMNVKIFFWHYNVVFKDYRDMYSEQMCVNLVANTNTHGRSTKLHEKVFTGRFTESLKHTQSLRV